MSKIKQRRPFAFTWHAKSATNPKGFTEDTVEWLKGDEFKCDYLTFGREVCPTTGGRHLQGYVYFRSAKTESAARTLMPCNIEFAEGKAQRNREYIWGPGPFVYAALPGKEPKPDKVDFDPAPFEKGKLPLSQEEKGACSEAYYKRNAALALSDPDGMDPSARFRIKQFLESETIVRRQIMAIEVKRLSSPAMTHFQFHTGVTGSGKSHWAETCQPEATFNWSPEGEWNNYNFQKIVLFMDLDQKSRPNNRQMKTWFDLAAFEARVLYGCYNIRPQLMIITTNCKNIAEFLEGMTPAHFAAVKRRFTYFHWEHPYFLDEAQTIINPEWCAPDGLFGPTP